MKQLCQVMIKLADQFSTRFFSVKFGKDEKQHLTLKAPQYFLF